MQKANDFVEQLTGYLEIRRVTELETDVDGHDAAMISQQLRATDRYDSKARCDMCHSQVEKPLKCAKVRPKPSCFSARLG